MPKTFRQQLDEIFNPVPDSGVALVIWPEQRNQIEQAVRQLIERAKPTHSLSEDGWPNHPYNHALDEYHSNLLAEINGSQNESS